ncbi:mirror-image polydactyly gene 1 protein isoform X2 [Channa argus]|uniref:mirror-image polydactyly gene 1 protein isoform X2 n=1 Tax=Channa argus TaxID=215402 RepID=UPI0035225A2B
MDAQQRAQGLSGGHVQRPGISLDLDHCDWPQAPQHLQEPLTSTLSHRKSGSPATLLSYQRALGGAGEMEVDLSTSRGSSPLAEISVDGGAASRGPRSPVLRRHLIIVDDNFPQDIEFGRLQSFDRDKNISFLLKELDALRDINKKLQEQLVHKEKELQRKEVDDQLKGELREAQGWEKPTVVLDEILAAQKDRDQALMSRVLLANEERDEALLRARRLQEVAGLENLDVDDCDQDVDVLLQRVCNADSVQEVEHFGSVLVQHLHLTRQRRNDITAQEMKAVMHERDRSVAKCKQLEQDLVQKQEQQATKEELLRLQRERDRALEERQRLEVELQTLRAGHSSMDLISHPIQSPDEAVSLGPPALPSMGHLQEISPFQVQLQKLLKEKQKVETELQRCQEAETEARDQIQRLERLVEVLRKKVGTGSLRAVI